MGAILRLLGLNYTLVEAVDGRQLSQKQLDEASIRFLPGYTDPYHNRPMTHGEIGCFLSHYSIWRRMLDADEDLERVIVFEDDVRFTENATLVLKAMGEDLMKTRLEWDFIYLGRKKMSAHGDEFFVRGIVVGRYGDRDRPINYKDRVQSHPYLINFVKNIRQKLKLFMEKW